MSVNINADTTNGLVLTSDTSGEIKLQSAGADIATVTSSGITMAAGKTLPASALTGDIIQNAGPAFRAYANASQSLSGGTFTKITYGGTTFDITSDYSTANSRFTPSVAGYYMVGGGFYATTAIRAVRLYKNGSGNAYLCELNSSSGWGCYGYDVIYLNGTTDYVELYGYVGGTVSRSTGSAVTYFSAHLIQKA
jgi:hypothetical protein